MGATIALASSVYSTVSGFETQQRQAWASQAMGKYESAIDEQNAKLADLSAKDALERGQVEEQRQRMVTRQTIGATRAAQAAQGVDVATGSAVDVQASEAGLGELDALMIRNNAAREAYGYKVEAINYRQQGKLAAFAGANAAAGYRAGSYSSLLEGAANTYGIYQRNSNDRADLRTSQFRPGR